MVKKCVLLNCNVDDDTPTLEELSHYFNISIATQAKLLIEKFGFKPTSFFCTKCFWK